MYNPICTQLELRRRSVGVSSTNHNSFSVWMICEAEFTIHMHTTRISMTLRLRPESRSSEPFSYTILFAIFLSSNDDDRYSQYLVPRVNVLVVQCLLL